MSKSKADEDFVSVFSSPAKNVKIEGMVTVEKREKVGVLPRQNFRRRGCTAMTRQSAMSWSKWQKQRKEWGLREATLLSLVTGVETLKCRRMMRQK